MFLRERMKSEVYEGEDIEFRLLHIKEEKEEENMIAGNAYETTEAGSIKEEPDAERDNPSTSGQQMKGTFMTKDPEKTSKEHSPDQQNNTRIKSKKKNIVKNNKKSSGVDLAVLSKHIHIRKLDFNLDCVTCKKYLFEYVEDCCSKESDGDKTKDKFTCKNCNKIYAKKVPFRNHVLKHFRKAPKLQFFCPFCEALYTRKGPLNKHVKKWHSRDILLRELENEKKAYYATYKVQNKIE
ncbi:uncharacterized protein LOC129231736 [Uloborus diversus]|uniref:uncharacterized protein LOC129231736 n=1 Tax=Uloborus diversus TaxID=327109 RepID=UPI0024090FFE|nr:uncharacterized protein LOC129231736 [Uloborus diversus]